MLSSFSVILSCIFVLFGATMAGRSIGARQFGWTGFWTGTTIIQTVFLLNGILTNISLVISTSTPV